MRFLACCTMQRSTTMRKTPLKTSKSSIKDLKTTKKYDDSDALASIVRSVSMNTGHETMFHFIIFLPENVSFYYFLPETCHRFILLVFCNNVKCRLKFMLCSSDKYVGNRFSFPTKMHYNLYPIKNQIKYFNIISLIFSTLAKCTCTSLCYVISKVTGI